MQMMSIMETDNETNEEDEDSISPNLLLSDKKLTKFVRNLVAAGKNLNILDSLPCERRRQGWMMTRQRTGRYKPTYSTASPLISTEAIGSCG